VLRPALNWSLRPLDRLRGAVTARDTRAAPDLSPLDTGPLPSELKPLAGAFDNLLGRLDVATAGVRRFTADASHQMRTPLAVLKVQVALARRGDPRALDEIAEAANRLEHLVTQLLALARADEAGVLPELEQVGLREVALAVLNRRIGQAIDAGVEVTLEAPETEIFVAAHRTLLFEIVSNLLDNAIRYNRDGSLVVVSLQETESDASVVVGDDGPGIAAADLDRLGERFVRLGSSQGQEGSGLGFAIIKSASQRIGARLLVENTHPGLRVGVIFDRAKPSTAAEILAS
jgi:two-component system sensor histidine kinase TctE